MRLPNKKGQMHILDRIDRNHLEDTLVETDSQEDYLDMTLPELGWGWGMIYIWLKTERMFVQHWHSLCNWLNWIGFVS